MLLTDQLEIVCAIGYQNPETKKWAIGGSGFLTVALAPTASNESVRAIFVTAAHIIKKLCSQNLDSVIGLPGSGAHAPTSIFIMEGGHKKLDFLFDNDSDIAVADVSPYMAVIGDRLTRAPSVDRDFVSLADLKQRQVQEGTSVYLLGYPRGDNGGALLYPLVRKGVVANVQDGVRGSAKTAAVALSCAPGDSGGLVLAEVIEASQTKVSVLGSLISYRTDGEINGQDVVYGISDIVLAEYIKQSIRERLGTRC